MYKYGEGVAKDPKKAFEFINASAELGNPEALHILGLMYKDGVGVAKHPNKAFEFINPAAVLGTLRTPVAWDPCR